MESRESETKSSELKIQDQEEELQKTTSQMLECYEYRIQLGEVEAMYELGSYYNSIGNIEKAKEYWNMASELDHPSSMNNLAFIKWSEGNIDEAENLFRMALDLGNQESKINLAYLYVKKGYHDQARELVEQISETEDIQSLITQGNIYDGTGDSETAIKKYTKVIELGVEEPRILKKLGMIYYTKGDIVQAIEYLNRVLKSDDEDRYHYLFTNKENNFKQLKPTSAYMLGKIFENSEDYIGALRYYMISYNEMGYEDAVTDIGDVYRKMGDIDSAKDFYGIGVKLGHLDSYYNLAMIYHNERNNEK